jgi:hypothetical protein
MNANISNKSKRKEEIDVTVGELQLYYENNGTHVEALNE